MLCNCVRRVMFNRCALCVQNSHRIMEPVNNNDDYDDEDNFENDISHSHQTTNALCLNDRTDTWISVAICIDYQAR